MLFCVSLECVGIFPRKKANKAIALNRHCLILAFRIAFDLNIPRLKDHETL